MSLANFNQLKRAQFLMFFAFFLSLLSFVDKIPKRTHKLSRSLSFANFASLFTQLDKTLPKSITFKFCEIVASKTSRSKRY